jgi:hypothetical protein
VARISAVIIAMGLAASSAFPAEQSPISKPPSAPPTPMAQPAEVKIVSMPTLPPPQVNVSVPTDESALAKVTWVLAIATIGLCLITALIGRKQSRDMRESIKVGQAAAHAAIRSANATIEAVEAAARQRRELLEREVHGAAQRVIAMAARVLELAQKVPLSAASLAALAGICVPTEAYQRKFRMREQRISELMTSATMLVGTLNSGPPDTELTAGLREMDKVLAQLEMLKESVTDELRSIDTDTVVQRQLNETRTLAAGGRVAPPLTPR